MIKPFFILSLLTLFCTNLLSQNFSKRDISIITGVKDVVEKSHIDFDHIYPQLPSRFPSQLAFQLDRDAKYLTSEDVNTFHELFDHFYVESSFTGIRLEKIYEIFKTRLNVTDSILNEISNVQFYESDSIYINIDQDTTQYSKGNDAFISGWLKNLKYQVVSSYKGTDELKGKSTAEINSILNQKLQFELSAEICEIELLKQDDALKNYVLNAYLRAFCQSFDPHTDYFSFQEENSFLTSLSSDSYGTGITYQRQDNKFIITQISPLSHASFIDSIKVGDEITGVYQKDVKSSLFCVDSNELYELFYGSNSRFLVIDIRSNDDKRIRKFKIQKSKVSNSENHTYGFILNKEKLNVGYIQFPSFYSPFKLGSNSSADDLSLVMLELKNQNIENIIIDLRNNGGGSVNEANELLSYFIDYGPLFTFQSRSEPEGVLFKDTKRGKLTQGKLIFLVNTLSASASELVVYIMKKYPKALVVGSPTYGKATGQSIYPISDKSKIMGSVKVTDIKIYGFDGTNYQGVGVIPDIILPSVIDKSIISESKSDYMLRHGEMRRFRPISYREEPIDSLISLSHHRNSLGRIELINQTVKERFSSYIQLHYNDYENPLSDFKKSDSTRTTDYEVISIESNDAYVEQSNKLKSIIEQDLILNETFRIFNDWILIKNKK